MDNTDAFMLRLYAWQKTALSLIDAKEASHALIFTRGSAGEAEVST